MNRNEYAPRDIPQTKIQGDPKLLLIFEVPLKITYERNSRFFMKLQGIWTLIVNSNSSLRGRSFESKILFHDEFTVNGLVL